MPTVSIKTEICKKCGSCTMVCPEAILTREEKGVPPTVNHPDECISCGQCVSICPAMAVQHSDYPYESLVPINQDIIPQAEQVLELLMTRRSVRTFRDAPVEKEVLEKILDAARYAPTARNIQSSQYIVIQDKDTLRKLVELTIQFQRRLIQEDPNALPAFSHLSEAFDRGEDGILRNAPALIIFHGPVAAEFPEVNSANAAQNAALATYALGLGSFFAGYMVDAAQNDDAIPALLSVPKDRRIYAALAIGTPRIKVKRRMPRRAAEVVWR